MNRVLLLLAVALASASMTGCARQRVDRQLGTVAKEWSKTIRASQVIPIYPLSEDLQPGDCFVVEVPTEDEVQLWEREGFLPLVHHVARLNVTPYSKTYRNEAYGVKKGAPQPPTLWQRLRDGAATTRPAVVNNVFVLSVPLLGPLTLPVPRVLAARHIQPTHWDMAPRASFPTFRVAVSTETAGDASIPISGLPLGLSVLNAQEAVASVTLSDAYTYGQDVAAVLKKAQECLGGQQLARYEPREVWDGEAETYRKNYSYLRVVHRVYLVGGVNVSVTDTSDTQAGLRFFRPKPSDDPAVQKKQADALAAQNAALAEETNRLNRALALASVDSVPGGAISVTDRSTRSISLKETFDRPLVVGYISFDIPIGKCGKLGKNIVATQVRLDRGRYDSIAEWAALYPHAAKELCDWLEKDGNSDWLRGLRPDLLKESTPQQRAERLRKYLAKPWWQRYMYRLPGMRIASDRYRQINARILHDVIRKPSGIDPGLKVAAH